MIHYKIKPKLPENPNGNHEEGDQEESPKLNEFVPLIIF